MRIEFLRSHSIQGEESFSSRAGYVSSGTAFHRSHSTQEDTHYAAALNEDYATRLHQVCGCTCCK